MQQPSEQPIYLLPHSKKRAIIPKIFTLLLLSFIFYLGILINISLLKLTANEETIIKVTSLVILLFLIFLGTFLTFRQAKQFYKFYSNQITFKKKKILYLNITNTTPHQDLFDKIFKTYSINLGNNFHLRHISQSIQIQNYIQQLIEYAKKIQ